MPSKQCQSMQDCVKAVAVRLMRSSAFMSAGLNEEGTNAHLRSSVCVLPGGCLNPPPFANPRVVVAGVYSLLEIPTDSYHFPSHLTPLSDPNSHFARKALSATPGLAPRGLGTRQELAAVFFEVWDSQMLCFLGQGERSLRRSFGSFVPSSLSP